ncbi:RICIN domain-containing protein [Merismopedia glauca]
MILVAAIAPSTHGHGDGVEGDLANMGMKKLEAGANPKAGLRSNRTHIRTRALVQGSPDRIGQWSGIINTPVVPIFATLLPNKKVLMWDSVGDAPTESFPDHNFTRAAVWNPNNNTFVRVDVSGFNIFCAGFAHLADGRLFVAGGNKDADLNGIRQTHIFDFKTNSWSRGPDMAYERWYPSVAALANGEHFVMGGGPNTHEVRQTNNLMRSLTNAVLAHSKEYPFIQTSIDGRVFYAGPQSFMGLLNTSGTGVWQFFGNRDNIRRSYGSYVMFDVGKFLVAGGDRPPTTSAVTIDLNSGAPSVSATSNAIYPRRQHNMTVLPDGTVLTTGGLSSSAALVDLNAGVYAAELWNPATGTWQELASAEVTRQYHSVALLLPDGRVMTGGGGICGTCQQVGYLRKDMEIFSPPYLFKPDGSGELATRPTIGIVPGAIAYNNSWTLQTPDAASIAKVSLIRLGAPTHSQDMDQRYIPLNFTRSNAQLQIVAPANANIAPPGYYMLFIVNSSGVPSVAKTIKVQSSTSFVSTAIAKHSNKCLDVPDGQIANGVSLQQLSCNGTKAQSFKFSSVSGVPNTYKIINTNSNKCVDVNGSSSNDGEAIVQQSCKNILSQQFRLEPVDNGYYQLIARHSDKCIDVDGISQSNEATIIQWPCHGGNNQQWKLNY